MPNKRLLAALGFAAALAAGGAAVVVGVPGVSGAQTSDAPTTAPPDPGASQRPDGGGARDHNCPNMEGRQPPGDSSSSTGPSGATSTGFRGRGGGRTL